MANPNDIDQRLINSNYTYKKTMGGLDNARDNPNHIRCHRDYSTEFFTNIMKIDNNSNPVTNNEFKEGAIKYVESIIYYIRLIVTFKDIWSVSNILIYFIE